jgi:hypothetical protein
MRVLCRSALKRLLVPFGIQAPVGTTTRYLRKRRGTTPLAALSRDRSLKAVTGLPVRFY